MYNTLKKMYNEGKLDVSGLEKAVEKGWITQDQLDQIIAEGPIQTGE